MDSQLNAIDQASNVLHPHPVPVAVVPVPSILVTSSSSSPVRCSPELVLVPTRTDYGSRSGSPRFEAGVPGTVPVEAKSQSGGGGGDSRSSSNEGELLCYREEHFVRPVPPPGLCLQTPTKGVSKTQQRKGRLATIASAFKASIHKTPKTLCVILFSTIFVDT